MCGAYKAFGTYKKTFDGVFRSLRIVNTSDFRVPNFHSVYFGIMSKSSFDSEIGVKFDKISYIPPPLRTHTSLGLLLARNWEQTKDLQKNKKV